MSAITAYFPVRKSTKVSCNLAVNEGPVKRQSFNDLLPGVLLLALKTVLRESDKMERKAGDKGSGN